MEAYLRYKSTSSVWEEYKVANSGHAATYITYFCYWLFYTLKNFKRA